MTVVPFADVIKFRRNDKQAVPVNDAQFSFITDDRTIAVEFIDRIEFAGEDILEARVGIVFGGAVFYPDQAGRPKLKKLPGFRIDPALVPAVKNILIPSPGNSLTNFKRLQEFKISLFFFGLITGNRQMIPGIRPVFDEQIVTGEIINICNAGYR